MQRMAENQPKMLFGNLCGSEAGMVPVTHHKSSGHIYKYILIFQTLQYVCDVVGAAPVIKMPESWLVWNHGGQ